MTLASLSVFDFDGREFLTFYAVAFVVALVWSLVLRSRSISRFSLPTGTPVKLTDPYEIAFLAGGAARCAQVAIVRLIKSGAIGWGKTRFTRESRLHATGSALPEFNDIERSIYVSVKSYGKKGMPLAEIPRMVGTRISGIEAKLAKLGLRPTASEAGGRGCMTAFPMLILMLVGGIKVAVGISRDKPVGFLILFLFVSFIVTALLLAGGKKLTPAGEKLLKDMRTDRKPVTDPSDPMVASLCGIALFGVSGVGYDPALAGLDSELEKEISQMGKTNSSSGCGSGGCSSGCSSGCGGGCGGCGGGD